MPARLVQVTIENFTSYPIRWVDDGRDSGDWQKPWYPSNLKNLQPGQSGTFRIESDGIMTGAEGWAKFLVDIPPTNEGFPRTENYTLIFKRPYLGGPDFRIEDHPSPRPPDYDSWPKLTYYQPGYRHDIANQGGETIWAVIPAGFFAPVTIPLFWGAQVSDLHPAYTVRFYDTGQSSAAGLHIETDFVGTFPPLDRNIIPSFLYGVTPAGNLLWFRHDGASKGLTVHDPHAWQGPSTVGRVWGNFKQIFVGDGNVIYGITPEGLLQWYRHDGFNTGIGLNNQGHIAANAWSPKSGTIVGIGWENFKHVFSGGKGVFYAIDNDNNLLWYKHNGSLEGLSYNVPGAWSGPSIVDIEWDFEHVFSGGDGIIYAVDNNGDLYWFKHLGFANGENKWDGTIKVGNGWNNFSTIFSAGLHSTGDPHSDGVIIYAITGSKLFYANGRPPKAGTLLWYKHKGYKDGTFNWEGSKNVGTGWNDFKDIIAFLPGNSEILH